jgi:Fe-S-cluster-containing hydrogenase component 2
MHAARNISLCTKDCLCLFVCPTGATDTETGQIDFDRCLDGCRLCVDACPSHALYLVMDNYAEPKQKSARVTQALQALMESKSGQETVATTLASTADSDAKKLLAKAFAYSNRILAEDCGREAGFMLPQSAVVRDFLIGLLDQPFDETFPTDAVRELLELV